MSVASDGFAKLGFDEGESVLDIITEFMKGGCWEVMVWGSEDKLELFWIVELSDKKL